MSTISMPRPKWDVETIRSRDVVVKAASGTIEAKAGHLVFAQADGSYKAYAVSTASSGITDEGYIGVLGHDATLTTTGATVKVVEAGIVYINAIREAGITSAKFTDDAIRMFGANRTSIVFDDYKKGEI